MQPNPIDVFFDGIQIANTENHLQIKSYWREGVFHITTEDPRQRLM